MRNNRKTKQKSLKLKLKNGGRHASLAKVIQGFALDLHLSGLFEKVVLSTDLKYEFPEVHLTLVPIRHGTAPIVDTPDGEIHAEKIQLRGYFNMHAGSMHVPSRALEMTIEGANLKGWHPDHHAQSHRKVVREVVYKYGRPVAKTLDQTLPKDERRMSAQILFNQRDNRFCVNVLRKDAAAYLIDQVIARGLVRHAEMEERPVKDHSLRNTEAGAQINRRHRLTRLHGSAHRMGMNPQRRARHMHHG